MSLERLAIDSSAAVDFFDPARPTPPPLLEATELFLPLPVLGELRFGALNSAPEWRSLMIEKLNDLVTGCRVLLPDIETADFYGRIRVGLPFPPTMSRRREVHLLNDVWIAALCLQHTIPWRLSE